MIKEPRIKQELIVYRTVDKEGDVWCECAFLFEDEHDVDDFFNPENPDLIGIFTDGDAEDKIEGFKIHRSPSGSINCIEFYTEYAGNTKIRHMSSGYYIKRF